MNDCETGLPDCERVKVFYGTNISIGSRRNLAQRDVFKRDSFTYLDTWGGNSG